MEGRLYPSLEATDHFSDSDHSLSVSNCNQNFHDRFQFINDASAIACLFICDMGFKAGMLQYGMLKSHGFPFFLFLFSLSLVQLRQAKTEVVYASKVAYRFLLGGTSNVGSASESPCNDWNRGISRFQSTWL